MPDAGYGAYLLRTLLALAAVCVLAALTLWMLRRRGLGGANRGGLRVVARLSLEPRRTLYVVEAAGKFLLVGVGDGPMSTLAELDAAQAAQLEKGEAEPAGFLDLVRRTVGGSGAQK